MYEFMIGASGGAYWLKGGQGITFWREYSRCCLPTTANFTGPLNVFDYKRGQAGAAALTACAAGAATIANEYDTSLFQENHVNEDMVITHLCVSIQRVTEDTALATDRTLALADARTLLARSFLRFYHEKQENPEHQGFIEEFPEAQGPDYESVGTNFFTVNNGPTWANAARPLPRPLPTQAKVTFIKGEFQFGQNRGGVTMSQQPQGIMVYLHGYRGI